MFISPARVIGKAASHLQTRGPRRLSSTGAGRQGAYDQRRKGTDHTNEVVGSRGSKGAILLAYRPHSSGTAVSQIVAQVAQVGAARPHAPHTPAVGVTHVLSGVGRRRRVGERAPVGQCDDPLHR